MATGSILIVDDDDNIRDLVVRHLNAQGHQASAVASGEEAVPHLDRRDLDLVVTDFKMPGMHGLDLARRSLMVVPDRPVILMTAFADVDNARESVTLGIYDFLVKPFDLEDFEHAVRRAIDHRHLVLQNQMYQRSLELMVEERTRELQEALDKLNHKVKELEGRDRINQHLRTISTIEETLSAILEAVQSALGVERAMIFLPDVSGEKLEPATGIGVQSPKDQVCSEVLDRLADSWMEEAGVAAYRAFLGRLCHSEGRFGRHTQRCCPYAPAGRGDGSRLRGKPVQQPASFG